MAGPNSSRLHQGSIDGFLTQPVHQVVSDNQANKDALMNTTLITFIGRTPKTSEGYRKTVYSIDGHRQPPSAFLGFNLKQYLKPDRIVILGTAGSMWDHLFEGDIDFGNDAENDRLELAFAVEESRVTQAMLDQIQPVLADKLGIDTHLQLIQVGTTLNEQIEVVELMSRHVDTGDQVQLDITHGLRSLPMIALLTAMYLRNLRQATIEGIWYGAFELRQDDITPVNNLQGLLQMADWLSAMHAYSKDGDYGVFSELLGEAGHCLKEAAFFERINNSAKAKQKLETWSIEGKIDQDPVARLFADELQQRIAWHRKGSRHDREQKLAKEYFKRGDYLRAAILALEAKISEELHQNREPDTRDHREEASKSLQAGSREFQTLSRIRNALAHGVRSPDKKIDKLLSDENSLATELQRLFKSLKI
ncbi:TIGR02221 family CRISPR-associated protein [Nitrincola tapanii]|uniref:TIGR02221 family CRISPR-associated protein n=2 Tax=Nitrincola tapanii TaxID=1708751 RepID=A0A5A9W252_9GAMM|nr:TIGR02221 family CRISPR-associated protein [Nitrincola tapanii]